MKYKVVSRQEFAYKAISGLRDESSHEDMYNALLEVWNSFVEDHLTEEKPDAIACSLMMALFKDYIDNNGILAKAKAEGCGLFEYLHLSESEVYNLMGPQEE